MVPGTPGGSFLKLYTRTGDSGSTHLPGGQSASKCHPRLKALGDIDEANASIGLAASTCDDGEIVGMLQRLQADLLAVGARLASSSGQVSGVRLDDGDVARLEAWIDGAWKEAGPLNSFILPGGGETSARLHLARAVCRRAERAVVELNSHEPVAPIVLTYVNRLSDLLFALSRQMNRREGKVEIPWPADAQP